MELAFPHPETDKDHGSHGMTLRDWFAGQALAGMFADPDNQQVVRDRAQPKGKRASALRARLAYEHADAMLAARSPEGGT